MKHLWDLVSLLYDVRQAARTIAQKARAHVATARRVIMGTWVRFPVVSVRPPFFSINFWLFIYFESYVTEENRAPMNYLCNINKKLTIVTASGIVIEGFPTYPHTDFFWRMNLQKMNDEKNHAKSLHYLWNF